MHCHVIVHMQVPEDSPTGKVDGCLQLEGRKSWIWCRIVDSERFVRSERAIEEKTQLE